MTKNQFRVLLVFVLCFIAVPAHAALTLLAEFSQQASWFTPGTQLPSEVGFSFILHDQPTNDTAQWSQVLTTADVGHTFAASADVVADFAAIALAPQIYLTMNIGPQPSGPIPLMDLQPPPPINDIPVGTLFVADVADYVISGINRVVDEVVIEWVPSGVGEHYLIGGAQTVRLYGMLIPEPSSFVLLLVAGAHWFLNHRRGNTARH